MLQLNVPHHQVTCKSLMTKTHWYKSLASGKKNSKKLQCQSKNEKNEKEKYEKSSRVQFLSPSYTVNPPQENLWRQKNKNYRVAGTITPALHWKGSRTKRTCFKQLLLAVCCVYSWLFQLRWMAGIREFLLALHCCTHPHTHTHTHVSPQTDMRVVSVHLSVLQWAQRWTWTCISCLLNPYTNCYVKTTVCLFLLFIINSHFLP